MGKKASETACRLFGIGNQKDHGSAGWDSLADCQCNVWRWLAIE